MSIELRSAKAIKYSLQSLQDGDYSDAKSIDIRLHTPFFKASIPNEVKEDLVSLVENLPSSGLKTLEIRSTDEENPYRFTCHVPVEMIARAMAKARGLTNLKISMVVLIGDDKEYSTLADSVKDHPTLKEVAFKCESRHRTNITTTTTTTLTPFDPVVTALGNVQTLKRVEFNDYRLNPPSRPTVSHDALAAICSLPRLEKLVLMNFKLQDEHLSTIAQHLKDKKHLTDELALESSCLGKAGSDALGRIFRQNKQISFNRLFVENFNAFECSEEEGEGPDHVKSFLQALEGSKCKDLQINIHGNEGHRLVLHHLRKMLRVNYSVERVHFRRYVGKPGSLKCYHVSDNEVEFLTKTNELGRGQLFNPDNNDEAANNTTWLTMLDATKYDLNNIYYLVQSSPLKFVELMEKHSNSTLPATIRDVRSMLDANKKAMQRAVKGVVSDVQDIISEQDESMSSTIYDSVVGAMEDERQEIIEALKDFVATCKKESDDDDDDDDERNLTTSTTDKVLDSIDQKIIGATDAFRKTIQEETASRLKKGEKARKVLMDKVDEQANNIRKVQSTLEETVKVAKELLPTKMELEASIKKETTDCLDAAVDGLRTELVDSVDKKVDEAVQALHQSMDKKADAEAMRWKFVFAGVAGLLVIEIIKILALKVN